MDAERTVRVERRGDSAPGPHDDLVAHEEPLGIRVQGVDVAVVMRTPGHDLDLVRGFLVTEGLVSRSADIVRVAHCDQTTEEAEDNIVDVVLGPGVALDLDGLRRNLYASSSCGICGKATVDNAMRTAPPLTGRPQWDLGQVVGWPSRLLAHQETFRRTGGLHGVMLVDDQDRTICVREDVGRHNAVDKAVGAALAAGRFPLEGAALVVSGRVSFEVVQKAAFARVGTIAAVSAPTSLAVRTADALGITLCGFVRDGRCNVYAHSSRIRS